MRAETVQSLREAGLSVRAIASATNEPVMTVQNELAGVHSRTPEPAPADFVSDAEEAEEAEEIERLAKATEPEFEAALAEAREQGDLSRENVLANIPVDHATGEAIDDDQGSSFAIRPRQADRRPGALGQASRHIPALEPVGAAVPKQPGRPGCRNGAPPEGLAHRGELLRR